MKNIPNLFFADSISCSFAVLAFFLSTIIFTFSRRYLDGSRLKASYLYSIVAIKVLLVLSAFADHLILQLVFSYTANILLALQIRYSGVWKQANNSSYVAIKLFTFTHIILACSFYVFYRETGFFSIREIAKNSANDFGIFLFLIFVLMQSAVFPFHRWLVSLVNAPTPTSGMMHSGIINGAGIILLKFHELFINNSAWLNIIFVIGVVSAVAATYMKLMQNDIKRMLTLSTSAQMAYMLVEFGAGLFSAAASHMILHAIFKTYLFLMSSSAAQQKKQDLSLSINFLDLSFAATITLICAFYFAYLTNIDEMFLSTHLLYLVVFILSIFQLNAMTYWQQFRFSFAYKFGISLFITSFSAFIYNILDRYILSGIAQNIVALNFLHYIGIFFLIFHWFCFNFSRIIARNFDQFPLYQLLYVRLMNLSQPYKSTITSNKTDYKYV